MITNHYDHTVDSEIPTTGVLNISDINTQVLNDVMLYEDGINLDSEERETNFKLNIINDDYGIQWDELSESTQDELLQLFYDRDESYPDDTWIIGDWQLDENGQYKPDKTGEFSAIVRESTIQVVYSKYIIRVKSLCSPCYPGQADISIDDEGDYLTSEKGFLTYNLPDEFFDNNY